MPLAAGINTNFDPESQALKTLRVGQNIDTFRQFRSIAKVPGSTKITASALGGSVRSLHQFTYTSLAGVRTRKQVAVAIGNLFDITGGTPTNIYSDTTLYDEPLYSVVTQNRMFLSSENQRGIPTGCLKYDGDRVTPWGVVAPGAEAITYDTLDSSAGWTPNADASLADSSTSRDGGGSISLSKTGVASSDAIFSKAALGYNFAVSDTLYVWLFIPQGALQKLIINVFGAVFVEFGDAGLANSDQHFFKQGELVPGWNLLSMPLASPDATTGTGAPLAAIDTMKFSITLDANGTTQSGFLFDRVYGNLDGTVTPALGADGNVDDTVSYRVTFLSEYGVESNGGSVSATVIPSSGAATGTLSFSGVGAAAETVTIGTTIYTFRAALTPTAYEVLIGASTTITAQSLADAINASGNIGTTYADGTLAHPSVTAVANAGVITLTARTVGTGGNSIATTETSASCAFAAATLTLGRNGQQVNLTSIPRSTDGQVIARRIYRDSGGDRVYRFVDQLDNNTGTTFTDDVSNDSLGEATMPIAGDDLLDSSPPERMRHVVLHENRIFGISGDDSTIILVSDVNAPEQFRLIDQITVDEELVALRSHPLGLILYGRDRALILLGNGVTTPFRVENLNSEFGLNSPRAITDVLGLHVTLSGSEAYLVSDPREPWQLNQAVLDSFTAASPAQLDAAFLVHDRSRYRVLFYIGSAWYSYQYATVGTQTITGEGPGVGPKDVRLGAWFTLSVPNTPTCAESIEESANKPEVWYGASDGHVYQLQDVTALSYANGASTAAIDSDFTPHDFPVGPPGDRGAISNDDQVNGRGEARYLLLSNSSTTGITWEVTVYAVTDADGFVLGSVTFNVVCPVGDATVVTPIPPIGSVGGWCRVRIRNNVAGVDGIISGLRVFYTPRSSFRGTATR